MNIKLTGVGLLYCKYLSRSSQLNVKFNGGGTFIFPSTLIDRPCQVRVWSFHSSMIPIRLPHQFAMLHAKCRLWRMYHLPSVVGEAPIQDVACPTHWMPKIWVCLKEVKTIKISHVWSFSQSFLLAKMAGLDPIFWYHSQISWCWLDTLPPCYPLQYISSHSIPFFYVYISIISQ